MTRIMMPAAAAGPTVKSRGWIQVGTGQYHLQATASPQESSSHPPGVY